MEDILINNVKDNVDKFYPTFFHTKRQQSFYLYQMLIVLLISAACNLNTADEPTFLPTPIIPRVQFVMPQEGDRMINGFDLTIDVVAQDEAQAPDAGIAKIELYLDGQLIREATPENDIPPPVFRAEMNWFAEGVGLHALSAIAYRRDGTRSDEALLNIEVVNE